MSKRVNSTKSPAQTACVPSSYYPVLQGHAPLESVLWLVDKQEVQDVADPEQVVHL